MAKNEKIEKKEGDTFDREIVIEDPATGVVRSLWDFKISFLVKRNKDDADADAHINKRWLAGSEHGLSLFPYNVPSTGETIQYGRCPISLSAEEVATFEFGWEYRWEIEVITPEGRVMSDDHWGTFTYNVEQLIDSEDPKAVT